MAIKNTKKQLQNLEINLIRKDICFYEQLFKLICKKESGAVLIFNMMPYISLFTIETHKYIKNMLNYYNDKGFGDSEKIIKNARNRLKFFDESKNKVDGSLDLFDEIDGFLKDFFINSHKGELASIKKILQPDMGIFLYNNHIISSTHICTYIMSLETTQILDNIENTTEKMGDISMSVGMEFAQYLTWIKTLPDFKSIKVNKFKYEIDDSRFDYLDIKANDFYSSIFDECFPDSINFSLTMFLSVTNFIHYFFNNVASKELIHPCFKIKFLTLFHIASSLHKLQAYCYFKNHLSDKSKVFLKEIFNSKSLKMIRSKKELRDILMHYRILIRKSEDPLPKNLNYQTLIEFFFDKYSFDEIDKIINNEFKRISNILEEWSNLQLDV